MAWYDLNEKKESKKDYIARVKYDEILTRKAKDFKQIINNELTENVQYRIVTENSFNAISVIEFLIAENQIDEIYIAIYRMNIDSVNKLIEYIENNEFKINIVISSFFRENKKYERWAKNLFSYGEKSDKLNIAFAWNHAKVFLCKTTDGKHIVFEGSGNLSDNARIEQYIIENNKITYNFHKEWINELLNIK